MQTKQTIIEQYLAADEEERLAMFLSHRECRRQFVTLEMTPLKAAKAQKSDAQVALRKRSRYMEFHDICLGWLKRCGSAR
jgi:hypothetical protein